MPAPNEIDQNLIAQIAAQKLGPAAAPQGQPQGAPEAPPPPPKADPSPTNMEKAQAKASPKDQSKESADVPVSFLKVGDREYTEDQLKGTMGRYKDLNYKWQSNKPIMDVLQQIGESARKSGYDPKPNELADLVSAAVKAYVKDPQFGGQKEKQKTTGESKAAMSNSSSDEAGELGDMDKQYEQWERENAVKLPPGFKDTATTSKAMSQKMDQMMSMFQNLLQSGQAGQQAQEQAGQQMQQARSAQAEASQKMVTNNLLSAFQKNGLPTDPQTRSDFRAFSAQRGYDIPDFLDPELSATVVADYKANKDAPEMARFRDILSKRQPYTEVGAATGGGATAPAQAADPMLQSMVSSAMQKRGMA